MSPVLVRSLADDVWTVLHAVANLNTYRGEILDADGQPVDPPLDPDGRVHPYAVAYFGGGQHTSNRVCAIPNKMGWGFHVACVGGDDNRCLWAIDAVRTALTGTRFSGGVVTERLPSVTLQRVDSVQPSRTFATLEFGLYVCG